MFKLLFKPIKWVLSIVLFFVILIAIPLITFYKPVKRPETLNTNLVLEEYIKEEIDHFIDKENEEKKLGLLLDEDLINSEINKRLIEQFGSSSNPDYLFEDENVMFQGVWVNINEKSFDIIAGVHANARILTYKTSVLISFKIIDEQDGNLILKLNKFKVGHASLKWAIKYAPSLIKRFLGQDVDSFIDDSLGNIGTYDSNKMELKINLYNLASNMEENKDIFILLLDLIYENELLEIGVIEHLEKYKFRAAFNLKQLEDKSAVYKLAQNQKFEDDDDFMHFLENKAISGILSGKGTIKFNQLDMNKIIDYIFKSGENLTNDYLMKNNAYEDYEITILNPYVEINNNKLDLIVPVTFGKDDNLFKTKAKISVTLETSGNDLLINLSNLSLGSIDINNDKINEILKLTEVDGLEDTSIKIDNFLEPFEETGVKITDINISDSKVNFVFDTLNVSDILDDINNEINNPNLNNKANELLDKINNDQEITEEDIEDLLEILEDLRDRKSVV